MFRLGVGLFLSSIVGGIFWRLAILYGIASAIYGSLIILAAVTGLWLMFDSDWY